MKVTIYDVAREAGLSIATVSRVINGKGGVTLKSEKKIRDAITRLGYMPDASAQGLASNLVNTIGLVMAGSVSSNYSIQYLDGAEHAARERGFDLLLVSTAGTPEEFVRYIRTRHKIDGILFCAFNEYVKPMYASGFPMVYTGQRQQWDERCVHVYGGFSGYRKEALSLLFSKGCRKVIYLDGGYTYGMVSTTSTDKRNRQVIEETLVTHGLEPEQVEYISYGAGHENQLYKTLQQKFLSEKRPDGIFVLPDVLCPQIYMIASQCGLSIPKDIKVIASIHNEKEGALLRPALTAYLVNAYQMGYNAAVKLIQIIQGGVPDENLTYVPYTLLERESV